MEQTCWAGWASPQEVEFLLLLKVLEQRRPPLVDRLPQRVGHRICGVRNSNQAGEISEGLHDSLLVVHPRLVGATSSKEITSASGRM
jgi:hypothetical protein